MKNKIINITILLLLVVFISIRLSIACEELNKSPNDVLGDVHSLEIELPAAFSGSISSSGTQTDYILFLNKNRFKEVILTGGENKSAIERKGNWELTGGVLYLFDDRGNPIKNYSIKNSQLQLAKRFDDSISNLPDGFTIYTISEYTSILNHHSNLREEGVQFTASGNEPFWTIQIDRNNNAVLTTPGFEINTTIENFNTESLVIHTNFETDSETAYLSVSKQYCVDSMSGFLFTHTITLSMDSETMYGCGKVL